jgi:hypothetical protein
MRPQHGIVLVAAHRFPRAEAALMRSPSVRNRSSYPLSSFDLMVTVQDLP